MSNEELVKVLLSEVWEGMSLSDISRATGMSKADVSRIVNGKATIGMLNVTRLEMIYRDNPRVLEAINRYKETRFGIPTIA